MPTDKMHLKLYLQFVIVQLHSVERMVMAKEIWLLKTLLSCC